MKKISFFLFMLCMFTMNSFAQTIDASEPDFIGESITILPDNSVVKLEKETVMLRTRANASALIVGVGQAKTKMIIESPSAGIRLHENDSINFIVKCVDNETDPISIIRIIRFESTGKRRLAEVASMSTFGSIKNNKLECLPFTATKYGKSSYLITLSEKTIGEYGITVNNPNNLDERQVIVSTFAIDE